MHETPFSVSIKRRIKWEYKKGRKRRQIKVLTFGPDFAQSNKYLEAIIQCLKLKILNENVKNLFYKIKNRIKSFLSNLIS